MTCLDPQSVVKIYNYELNYMHMCIRKPRLARRSPNAYVSSLLLLMYYSSRTVNPGISQRFLRYCSLILFSPFYIIHCSMVGTGELFKTKDFRFKPVLPLTSNFPDFFWLKIPSTKKNWTR